jgi:hypothetical protein
LAVREMPTNVRMEERDGSCSSAGYWRSMLVRLQLELRVAVVVMM